MINLSPFIKLSTPFLSFLFSPLIKPQCLVCHREITPSFPMTPNICHRCLPSSKLAIDAAQSCTVCGHYVSEYGLKRCDSCSIFPLPFSSFKCCFHYRREVRDLIRAMKFTPSKKLAQIVAQHLARSILGEKNDTERVQSLGIANNQGIIEDADWDLIVPIPSGPKSTSKRLFTPSIMAGREISRALNIDLIYDVLKPRRSRALQASLLTSKERFKNSKEAFSVRQNAVQNKKILLIDDVITTGATIGSATISILQAGAASVSIRAFALSDRYDRTRPELYNFIRSVKA